MKLSIKNILCTVSILLLCHISAQAANYFANDNPIDNVVNAGRVQQEGDVEVVEFFWYGCPHCAAFEPRIQQWADGLPKNVKFIRMPASWNESMTYQQKMFYTLEALNRLDLHGKVFNDIHKKHISLNTPTQITQWAVKQNISATAWNKAFASQAVADKVNTAQTAFKRYELSWVPAIIVNGKRVVAFTANILQDTDKALQDELHALDSLKHK